MNRRAAPFGARARARAWKRAAEAWKAYADGRGSWADASHADAQARALDLMERRHGARAAASNVEAEREKGRAFIARWCADDDPKGPKLGHAGGVGKKSIEVSPRVSGALMYGRASSGDKSPLEKGPRSAIRCGDCGNDQPLTPGCRGCEAWAAALNRTARRA